MKQTFLTFASALGAFVIVTTATFAIGTLTPSPTPGEETHYTLNDIYNKLTTGDGAIEGSGLFTTPSGVPTESFRTLTEIYEAIPSIDPNTVLAGTTILGVTGQLPAPLPPLEWSIDYGEMNWQTAVNYCDNLEEDGGGWRLPSITELSAAISDHYMMNIDKGFTSDYNHWSSTSYNLNSSTHAWVAGWTGMTNGWTAKTELRRVRCVR